MKEAILNFLTKDPPTPLDISKTPIKVRNYLDEMRILLINIFKDNYYDK